MKILITTDLYATSTNGVVTSVKSLARGLTERGHEVRILTLSEDSHAHIDGNVTYIGSHSLPVYPGVRMTLNRRHPYIKELIAWKPDVIHTQCELFTFRFARRISRCTGAPIVHTYHTLYEQYIGYILPGKKFGAWVVRTLSRKILNKCARVIAPTEKVRTVLLGYGVTSPIEVIPSGIELSRHREGISPEVRLQGRAEWGLTASDCVLLNLGRLGTEKNLDELIGYFAVACETNSRLRFLIVGDGPARAELEKHVKKLNVTEKVIFTGMVPPDRTHEYYRLGDLFVSASTSETQGLTYIEAAANGLPLLCRRDPCLCDVIEEGKNGAVYDSETDFFARLAELTANPATLAQMGAASAQLVEKFDRPVFAASAEATYVTALRG